MEFTVSQQDREWLEQTEEKLLRKLSAEARRIGGKIVYIPKDGRYEDLATPTGVYWWCNGFWPGMLWQAYHASKDETFRKAAETIEERLDKAFEGYEGLHHDVGFMYTLSALADYRLTGNTDSRRRALHAANLLAGRYNARAKFIRAWNGDRTGWTIADTMMNLPLLYWASRELGDPRFTYIAQDHADTCARVTVREDGSSYHISILDPLTGDVIDRPSGQGYSPDSAWSRGQAWIVYGYALSARHTGEKRYLDIAKKAAHYFIANLALTGWLPLCDFQAPEEPLIYDASAGACAACGLLELAEQVGEYEKALYQKAAWNILKAMEQKFCCWDPNVDGILGYSSKAYHDQKERETSIIYGDYFFTEAIFRLSGKAFPIW